MVVVVVWFGVSPPPAANQPASMHTTCIETTEAGTQMRVRDPGGWVS